MSWPFGDEQQKEIEDIIIRGARTAATLEQIIQLEVGDWRNSEKRNWMGIGERYYLNKPDILERKRTAIGADGAKVVVGNLANNKLANAFVRKLVDQKVGYLLGKPLSIQTDNQTYADALGEIFDKAMLRRLQSTGKEAVNKGIAWWFVYYDEAGNLSFRKMRSEEIIPLWADEAHTILDAVIRDYEVLVYEGLQRKTVRKIEWWDRQGVRRYVVEGTGLAPDVDAGALDSHFTLVNGDQEQGTNWERIPFIAWKYNEEEQPLVEIIKSLADDYDRNKSDNSNNLEDLPDSIYEVTNYDGTDPGEFRKNLSTYRTAFVSQGGGIKAIKLDLNTEAYKTHMEQARKDIYEFGRGVDTQGVDIGSAPSGIALKFLYSDLDLDASLMETEFQASLEQLLWFIDTHLHNTTHSDYSEEKVSFVFNKDMPTDESAIITAIKDSIGILSDETLITQHPWVTDVLEELKRIEKQKKEALKRMEGAYGGLPPNQPNDGDEDDDEGDEE
ncbi:phage portal protein [Paenibacillus pinisoli]|uniref:Phage portal protein n=1 Tax=Paenibacillus pinisoli TaxID=1276110 RepID=A0A3A6Q003_9BACL|nr:phage portal protein [Paenibacillus pinisoli]RJX40883.1 phage portal protein [Paenibacillus pinisoli]